MISTSLMIAFSRVIRLIDCLNSTPRKICFMPNRTMFWVTALVVALTLTVSDVCGVRLCGKNLADMLDLVCDNRGFHSIAPDRGVGFPRLTKRTASEYLSNSLNENPGIVGECCYRSCTLEDLESYCALPVDQVDANPTKVSLPRRIEEELFRERMGSTKSSSTSRVNINDINNKIVTTTEPPVITTTRLPSRSLSRENTGHISRDSFPMPNRFGSSKFFFVRPVGPRPTRSPVWS
uniref:IGF1 n=1 Tax=Sinohyriopsis cumingii TaxID=165450 RepID=A0A9E9JWR8_SINCU|nr:IGF1 [Sinohyriopsis cumingii]